MKSKLIEAARVARNNAYAIYSDFHVGAAVASASGKIYQGCNVENASYGLTICAERTALVSAIAAGEREFTHLVVATEDGVSPCGACRQVIWELCGDISITLVNQAGDCQETSASELLPHAFGQQDLG